MLPQSTIAAITASMGVPLLLRKVSLVDKDPLEKDFTEVVDEQNQVRITFTFVN